MMKERSGPGRLPMMAGFDGHIANDHAKRLIRDFRVQSLILFKRNVDGPAQVADLVVNCRVSLLMRVTRARNSSPSTRRADGFRGSALPGRSGRPSGAWANSAPRS
jgi:hypothetical protein